MRQRGLGVLLVLTFAVVIATLIQDFRFDRSLDAARASAARTNATIDAVRLDIVSHRAAQAAYLSTGQSASFWTKRAVDLATEIEGRLTDLESATTSADARPHYDAAAAALGTLNSVDQRAQDAVSRGDTYVASDLIFTDSLAASQHVEDEVVAAGKAERAAADARFAFLRQERFALNAAALTFGLLATVVMFWRRKAGRTAAEPVAAQPPAEAVLAPESSIPAPAAVSSHAASVSLPAAAEVCVDLGRVLEFRDVPPLLERAAKVIDAKGIILWMSDAAGAALQPSLGFGYPDQVLRRLGPLPVDGDNVTALAFRSMSAQVVRSSSLGSSGAIAVPLVTSAGCIGVLAAEVNQGRPEDDTLAVTRIFAAQLATLVAPAADAASQAAQG